MDFRLLGSLLIDDGTRIYTVDSAKQRVLLTALLLRAGQTVLKERLADVLWDGIPPQSADVTLRNYILRLRQNTGSAGARIVTRNGGYLIDVDEEELDLHRFGRLRAVAAEALGAGQAGRAVQVLNEAFALWRGQALEDIPCDNLCMDIRQKLEEQRIDALELKFEAELALGRHRAMISELLGLVTAHPLRERLWELLMVALFRAGRQAEALDTYRRVHRLLGDELGIRPGVQLSSLQRRILAGDVQLLGPLVIPGSS